MDPIGPFLSAVLSDPASDLPRLVYADALDNAGQHARAEFIRVQCEIARHEAAGGTVPPALLARERELWSAKAGDDSLENDGKPLGEARYLRPGDAPAGPDGLPVAIYRRGFVDEVRLRLSQFRRRVTGLFAVCPVTAVAITDRHPVHLLGAGWGWCCGPDDDNPHDPKDVPEEMWRPLPVGRAGVRQDGNWVYYPSRPAATAELSTAAVRFGRRRAGP